MTVAQGPKSVGDIVLGLVMMAVAAAFLWESIGLPESGFETLGPAAVPRGICAVIAICGLVILVQGVRSRTSPDLEAEDLTDFVPRSGLATVTVLISVAYVLAMATETLSFRIATVAYLVLLGGLLTGWKRKRLPIILVMALLMGFGGEYVFTRIFTVDLP